MIHEQWKAIIQKIWLMIKITIYNYNYLFNLQMQTSVLTF